MNGVFVADVLLIAGMLVTLGLIGIVLGGDDERSGRMFVIVLLAVALTIIAAGRRHGRSDYDLLAWTIAAAGLPRLCWPLRSSLRQAFLALSLCLSAAALVMTLMWLAR